MKMLRNTLAGIILGLMLGTVAIAALETGTYISDLVSTNPTSNDLASQGDDHLRLVKSTVKATFPNLSGAVTPTHTELNFVDGVTSAVQTQLNNKVTLDATTELFSGTLGISGRFNFGSTHKINADNGAGINIRNNADTTQIFHISNTGVATAAGGFSGVGTSLTALNGSNISSGLVSIATGGTGRNDGYTRNIFGKTGVNKTLSTSAASGGSDGDIWYRY